MRTRSVDVKMAPVRLRMVPCLLSVFLLSGFSSFVSCLYFDLGLTERRCFMEDIPDQTEVKGDVRTLLHDQPTNQELRMSVEAEDPDGELVLSQRFGSEGTFNFTSQKPGSHQICLQPEPSQRPPSAGDLLTVHLDIRVGEQTNNYTKIYDEERLTMLQLRVRQLTEQVRHIQREMDYQKVRVEHFLELSHNTDMWMFWWPVVRSLYVVAIITWTTNSW